MATRMDSVYPATKKKQVATYGRKRTYAKEGSSPSAARSSTEPNNPDANGTRRIGDNGRPKAKTITAASQYDEFDEYAFPPDETTTHRFLSRPAAPLRAAVAKPAAKRKIPQSTAAPRQAKKQRSATPEVAPTPAPKARAPVSASTAKTTSRGARTTRHKSTPPKDIVMQDATDSMPFSPATAQTLDKLSVGSRRGGLKQQEIPFRPTARTKVDFGSALLAETSEDVTLPQSAPKSAAGPRRTYRQTAQPEEDIWSVPAPETSEDATAVEPVVRPIAKPRRRLIDTLADQAVPSSDEDEDEDDDEGNAIQAQRSQKEDLDREIFAAIDRLDDAPASSQPSQPSQPVVFERQTSQVIGASRRPGLKFTYSSQRSYLADEPVGDSREDILAALAQPLLPAAESNLSAFDMDEDDDDGPTTTGAIRSVHELRQAGANNRFADELDDLIDRIGVPSSGKPSSTRRGALSELFSKLQDKSFLRQFKSHNGDTNLFKNLGRENDIIGGYSMIAILLTLLNTNALSVHLVQQLREQGIADLLTLLLQHDLDIAVIARDRKSNVSKHAQSSLATMKAATLRMSNLWKSTVAPTRLSPRTLALKALERILDRPKLTVAEDQIFSADLTAQLFELLSSACHIEDADDSAAWTSAESDEGVDLFLALSLVEVHSTCAAQLRQSQPWTNEDLTTAAELLETVLRFRGECPAHLECTVLKLVVNIANNNSTAQQIFTAKGLVLSLAEAACATLEASVKNIKQNRLPSESDVDSLVLMLGIMINFSEHDPEAGQKFLTGNGEAAVDRLIQVFLECHQLPAEAKTEEESAMNVAVGYLSVLLGYLCQYGPNRERFELLHSGGNLEPLISSLKEFSKIMLRASAQGHDPHGLSGRLQELASHLQSDY